MTTTQTNGRILPDLSQVDMAAELAKLRAENAALKAGRKPSGLIKVSAKGAISVYGLGRFPVTLYKSQMLKFLDMVDQIRQFMVDHDAELANKDE